MNIVYVENTQKIAIKDDQLIFLDGNQKTELHFQDVGALIIENTRTSLTIQTLLKLDEHDVLCLICDHRHQPTLTLVNQHKYYKLTHRLKNQIEWQESSKSDVAKRIILNKVQNQRQLLGKFNKPKAKLLSISLDKINQNIHVTHQEAIAARIYFKELFGSDFIRFNDDIINYALNYTYMCLSGMIAQIVVAKGLHPSIGVIHHSIFNNFNLVFDIIEIYRPLADFIVYKSIGKSIKLDKELKKKLLKIFNSKVTMDGVRLPIRNSVELYIDSIIDYFEKKKGICFPQLVFEL